MRVRLYPKNAHTYLIQFDNVVTVITEKTLFLYLRIKVVLMKKDG